jgi:hypothetical protein
MSLLDTIITKLESRVEKPYLIKRFDFTLEGLQDDPNQIGSIVTYLEQHTGKWSDFDILSQIDSETMNPYVLLILYLAPDWASRITPIEHTFLSKINPK